MKSGSEREYASGNRDTQNDRREPDRKPKLQRLLYFALETIHPMPLTFLMTSLPSFLRREWIRNSTALLSTSSFQPYRRSSNSTRDKMAPGRIIKACNREYSRAYK